MQLSSASGLDLSEKLLVALLRLSECDAVKLTLVRATGALNSVVSLLSAPIVNILTPVLGFVAHCASHRTLSAITQKSERTHAVYRMCAR